MFAQCQRLIDIAQIKDARIVAAGNAQAPRPRAGGDKKRVIVDIFAGAEDDTARPRLDGGYRGAEPKRDLVLGVPAFRADEGLLHRQRPGQQFLRQGGAFIRRIGLVADERHPAWIIRRAQCFRCAAPGVAGADDDNVPIHAQEDLSSEKAL
jgi:hypothetical protein